VKAAVELVVTVADDVSSDMYHVAHDPLHCEAAIVYIGLDPIDRDAASKIDRKFNGFVGHRTCSLEAGSRGVRPGGVYDKSTETGDGPRASEKILPQPQPSDYWPDGQAGVCMVPS